MECCSAWGMCTLKLNKMKFTRVVDFYELTYLVYRVCLEEATKDEILKYIPSSHLLNPRPFVGNKTSKFKYGRLPRDPAESLIREREGKGNKK